VRGRGGDAEDLALAYLARHGLKLVARNYRCRFGEIDLILREGATVVFAEVRLRGRADFGGAQASVTPGKQQKLLRAARHFLASEPRTPPCRFDVVLLDALAPERIEWIRDAFGE
jgi:putative endonuclease